MDRSRRGFFTTLLKQKHGDKNTAMLPYAKDARLLEENCKDCKTKECVNSCEENIIFLNKDDIPFVDFNKGGCTFCDKCLLDCSKDFLNNSLRSISANITLDMSSCLSHNQTMCFSCKDVCTVNAISFLGLFKPTIDYNICTKCGFCIGICPTNSIEIKGVW